MKSRFKYRIYPTENQKVSLAKLFGCTRTVWNDALAFCLQSYEKGEKFCGETTLQKRFITEPKKTEERQWLSEVSNIPLQQSIRDLGQAYQNFFKSCQGKRKGKKIRPPKFKKRKSRQSARFTRGGFKVLAGSVYLAKIGKLKVVWSRPLPSTPSSVTVIKDTADRYFLSFVVEIEPIKLPDNGKSIGIDLGIISFATFNTGEKIEAPKPLKKKLKKLRSAQRKLSRKVKCSKRRERARKKVAKIHTKIADIRNDFLHKLSTRVIRENQTIALEDLNVGGLIKNRKLSRAISDLGWRTFRTMLEAKAAMYGRDLRIIDRWEPTSQRCPCCGEKGGKKDLSVRVWTCLFCSAQLDRDRAAAQNILKAAGGHSEAQNGRGEKVRLSNKKAHLDEASTRPEFVQLALFEQMGITGVSAW